ncbi:MAG: hypothetical protein A2991_00490 [Candidatus Terrybacteria bacterium RIFCSPLOWO2_01_FULL_58_14]|uniref:Amidophosphoribosyltransferase n=1 Tax=Candidatus Terrybacteria bacterium RIFCSPLOWO2_01_FULL_58_14 TaxID=1802369 RepID=A0A1G2PWT3_9BACT|nr:MAG: hypothetical protein A2991_00490 [Candidatus Terrybacteria bacterium RIFCSPLOWO2_01_FULL_58_14]
MSIVCGVAGFKGSDEKAALKVAAILAEEQNRGQGSAGIAIHLCGGGDEIDVITKRGTVQDLRMRYDLRDYPGKTAVGVNRYATSGSTRFDMPPLRGEIDGQWMAFGVNGDTVNIDGKPWQQYRTSLEAVYHARSDTEVLLHLLAQTEGKDPVERMCRAFPRVEGAFSVVAVLGDGRMVLLRDRWGFRPLWIGRSEHGVAVASEDAALRGYQDLREVLPGEIIVIETDLTIAAWQYCPPAERLHVCSFESVYLKKSGSRGVNRFRSACGEKLAAELIASRMAETISNHIVVPVLDSGRDAALAFAYALGLRVVAGINRSRLSHEMRAFMAENHDARVAIAELKHVCDPEVLTGQDVILVEDSLLRGDTLSSIIPVVRRYARTVRVAIASPPVTGPCYYGIATPTRNELYASCHTIEETRRHIGADSLHYLSLAGYRSCFRHLSIAGYLEELTPDQHVCDACMSGNYPPFVPPRHSLPE